MFIDANRKVIKNDAVWWNQGEETQNHGMKSSMRYDKYNKQICSFLPKKIVCFLQHEEARGLGNKIYLDYPLKNSNVIDCVKVLPNT